jgi:hypothetical protein
MSETAQRCLVPRVSRIRDFSREFFGYFRADKVTVITR